MEVESLKKGVATVEKCIEELMNKGDITPAETKAALDGMELRELLNCEIENCKSKEREESEYAERGYSRHGEPYRQYHITSYGMPVRMHYSDRGHSMRSGYDPRMDWSGDYGVQGWYRSGDGMSSCGPEPYYYGPEYSDRGHGYSRHSIGDRVVSMMEKEMDRTESPYEREELKKFIHMVRSAADN